MRHAFSAMLPLLRAHGVHKAGVVTAANGNLSFSLNALGGDPLRPQKPHAVTAFRGLLSQSQVRVCSYGVPRKGLNTCFAPPLMQVCLGLPCKSYNRAVPTCKSHRTFITCNVAGFLKGLIFLMRLLLLQRKRCIRCHPSGLESLRNNVHTRHG